MTPEEEHNPNLYYDSDSRVELDMVHNESFLEWIVDNYKSVVEKLEFVSDRSQEGNQFCKGFGGVCGLLRYHVEFETYNESGLANVDSDDDFM